MKANASARQLAHDERAVADVMGSILLVGITILMTAGLAILVLSTDGPRDQVHADVRISLYPGGLSWGDGNENITLRHLGGEAFYGKDVEIRVSIDGVESTYDGADLDQGFADGTFSIGETWTLLTTVAANASVDVRIVHTGFNGIVGGTTLFASTAVAASTPAVTTYVDDITVTEGVVANVAGAQAADDSAVAYLNETTTPGATATARRDPGSVSDSSGVTGPGAALLADDTDVALEDALDRVSVTGFDLPAATATVNTVYIGFEASRGGGGSNNPVATLSYTGPALGPYSSQDFTVSSATDADHMINITSDRVWTIAAVESLVVQVERTSVSASFRSLDLDQIFIEVTYTEVPQTSLDAVLTWSGVPDRTQHELQIRYSRSIDTFRLQVWDGSTWTTRGSLSSSSTSVFSYTLASDEYLAGAPQVRIVDLDTDVVAGRVEIDYARIQSV